MNQVVLNVNIVRLLKLINIALVLIMPKFCLADALLISSDWKFLSIDGFLKIGVEQDFRALLTSESIQNDIKSRLISSDILKIEQSTQSNIGYLLIGSIKDNRSYGVLVIRLRPVEIIGFIQNEVENIVDYPLGLFQFKKGLYLTKWVGQSNGTQAYQQTEVYDPISTKLVRAFTKTKFVVNDITCGTKDFIYNGRLFNPINGEEVSRVGIPLGVYVSDCRDGYALGLTNVSVNDPVKLVIAKVDSDPVVKQEISTDERIIGFGIDEWRMSPEKKYVLRDEVTKTGRTGRVVFVDTVSNNKSELIMKRSTSFLNGIVGFLAESKMLYCGGDEVQIVDIQKPSILTRRSISSCPISILYDVQIKKN